MANAAYETLGIMMTGRDGLEHIVPDGILGAVGAFRVSHVDRLDHPSDFFNRELIAVVYRA